MNSKGKRHLRGITFAGMIAAMHIVLTLVSASLGLARGTIQFALSEALTVLPVLTPWAIPGVTIGCVLSNIVTGTVVTDVIFGSLATLIGAIGTWLLRKHRWVAPLPTVFANAIILPLVFVYGYGMTGTFLFYFISIFISECLVCYLLGMPLLKGVETVYNKQQKK